MNTNGLETALSQLRRLYVYMNESCKDSAQAKRLAHGMLAPAIEEIENYARMNNNVMLYARCLDEINRETRAPIDLEEYKKQIL
jgi:hypothetical protein